MAGRASLVIFARWSRLMVVSPSRNMSVGEAARLQLLPQALRESQRDVFFRQLVAERRAAFVAPVAGVHHHKILHRTWNSVAAPPRLGPAELDRPGNWGWRRAAGV